MFQRETVRGAIQLTSSCKLNLCGSFCRCTDVGLNFSPGEDFHLSGFGVVFCLHPTPWVSVPKVSVHKFSLHMTPLLESVIEQIIALTRTPWRSLKSTKKFHKKTSFLMD